MARLVIDWATELAQPWGEGELKAEVKRVLGQEANVTGLEVSVFQLEGPGGGWPELAIEGEREQVEVAARWFAEIANDDTEYWLSRVEV